MDWKFWIYAWITFLSYEAFRTGGTVVFEDRVRFLREPTERVNVNAGTDVEIPCLAVDGTSNSSGRRLSVRWMRNEKLADDLTPRANGSLILRNVQTEQEAIYQCAVLSTRYGVVLSQRANLTVSKITNFIAEPQDVTTSIGNAVRFQCVVAADSIPSITVKWFHNNLPLSDDGQRFRLLASGILQIVDVRQSDEGSYHCIASNVAGNITSRTATLTTSKDNLALESGQLSHLRVLKAPDNVSVISGQPAVFECLFDRPAKVVWKKLDDSPISSKAYRIGSNLVIQEVSIWDEGVYDCVGTDANGKVVTVQAHLFVNSPPEIRKLPEEKLSRRGEWWRFHCDTASKPAAEIVWYKDGERLRSRGRVKIFPNEDHPPARLEKPSGEINYGRDLLISSVQAEDVGIYQCFVSNYLGTTSAAAALSYLDLDLGGPGNLTASVLPNQREIGLSWQAPSIQDEQYQLTVYIVHFHESEAGSENTVAVQQDACQDGVCRTICCSNVDLAPHTNYTFWVDALVVYQGEPLFTRTTQIVVVASGDAVSLTVAPVLIQELSDPAKVRLSWSPPLPQELRGQLIEYKLEVKETTADDRAGNFRPAVVLPPTSSDYMIDGLPMGGVAYFRLIPRTRAGFPEPSPDKSYPWLRHRVRESNISVDAPVAPFLQAHALNATTVIVRWTPATGSNVMKWLISGYRPTDGLRLVRSDVNGTMDSALLLGLASDTLYQLSVAGVSVNDVEGLTASRLVRTSAIASPVVFAVPTGSERVIPFPTPNCRVIGPGKLKVYWNTPPMDIVKFALRYSLLPEDNEALNVSAHVKQIETSTNFVIFTDLTPARNYLFATRAENADGYKSSFSDDILCFMPMTRPLAPTDIQLSVVNGTSLRVSWTAPPHLDGMGEISAYHVRYSTNLADQTSWKEITVNASNTNAYVTGLNSSVVYFVSVIAENEAGRGDESPTKAMHSGASNGDGVGYPPATVVFQTSYKEGIIIGACIAVICAIACAVVIVIRSRSDRQFCIRAFPSRRRSTANKSPGHQLGNGHCKTERRIELAEIQTLLPRLIENAESDAKGGAGFSGPRGYPVTRANFSLSTPTSFRADNNVTVVHESIEPAPELLTVLVQTQGPELEAHRDHSSDLSHSPATASSLGSWGHSNNGDSANAYLLQRHHHGSLSMPNLFDSGIGFDDLLASGPQNGRYQLFSVSRGSPRRECVHVANSDAPVDSVTLPGYGLLINGNAGGQDGACFSCSKTGNGKIVRLRDLLVSRHWAPINGGVSLRESEPVSSHDRATSQCTC